MKYVFGVEWELAEHEGTPNLTMFASYAAAEEYEEALKSLGARVFSVRTFQVMGS